MKIFLDTANLDEIRQGVAWGILDGVTTNPSLIAREGHPLAEQIARIAGIVDGDISAEVVATEAGEMIKEGRRLAAIHPNVVVKVPLTREGIKACKALSVEGLKVNVTLCFAPGQALLAAKAGAYIISPFVGRIDDISWTGMDLVRDIVAIYKNYGFRTQVLAASLRHPLHVRESALAGAHIGTMPFKVLDSLFNHPLTDKGLEQFLKDWAKVFADTGAPGYLGNSGWVVSGNAAIVLLGLVSAVLVGLAGWFLAGRRITPIEKERQRRYLLNATGRMIDAEVSEYEGGSLVYSYEVGGVVYSATQDVSLVAERIPADPALVIGPATVKYLPRNPANSIVVSEEWSGLHSRRRVPLPDRKGA